MILPQLLGTFREESDVGIERVETHIAPVNRPRSEVRKKKTKP